MSEEAQMRTIQSCRLCLAPDNECISIFNSYAADKEPISSKIYNCVGIKITSDDHFSSRICHACVSYLNSWQSFKNRCLASQNKQSDWLNQATNSTQQQQQQQQQQPQQSQTQQDVQQHQIRLRSGSEQSHIASSILDGISTLKKRKSLTVYPLPGLEIKSEPVDVEEDEHMKQQDECEEMVDPTMFLERTEEEGDEPIMGSNHYQYAQEQQQQVVQQAPTQLNSSIDLSVLADSKEAACRACNLKFSTRANARRHERNLHPNLFELSASPNNVTITKPTPALAAALEMQRAAVAAAAKAAQGSPISTQKYRQEIVNAFNKCEAGGFEYSSPEKYQQLLTDEKIIFLQQNDEFLQQYQSMTCRCCNRYYSTYKNFMAHMRKKYAALPRNLCFNCLKLNDSKALFISHLKRRNCINLYKILQTLMTKNPSFAATVAATSAAAIERLRARDLPMSKMFECKACPKQFRLRLEFRAHVYEEHADMQKLDLSVSATQCTFCGLNLEDTAEHKQHQNNVECMAALRCVTCNMKFEKHQSYNDHFYEKHMVGMSEQPAIESNGQLDNSINRKPTTDDSRGSVHTSTPVASTSSAPQKSQYFSRMPQACPICGQQYNNYNNVLRHMESKHPDQLPQTYKCVRCGIGYPRLSNLREHMVTQHAADKARHTGFEYIVNADAVKLTDTTAQQNVYSGRYDYVMKDLMSITNGGAMDDDDDQEGHEQSSKKIRLETNNHNNNSNSTSNQYSSSKECAICSAVFSNNIGLSNHMRSHTAAAQNAAAAALAAARQNTPSSLSITATQRPAASNNAKTSQVVFKRSLEQAADRRFRRMRCRICQRRFSSKKSYRFHMLSDHQIKNVQFIKCKLCDAEFAYEKGLKVHMFKVHSQELKDEMIIKQYECDICSIVYRTESELLQHKRVVHGDEDAHAQPKNNSTDEPLGFENSSADTSGINTPVSGGLDGSVGGALLWYQCKYCASNFNTNKKLAIHINSHDEFDSNDYSCKDCGNVYSGRKSLWVHRYKKHPQVADPSECTLCKKVFFDSQMLENHIPTCNRKPISAHAAATAAADASAMYKHKTGDDDDDASKGGHEETGGADVDMMGIKMPEVACTMCGARFTDQELFSKHIQMHEMELYTDNPLAAMFDTGPADPNQFFLDRVNENGEYACDLCSKTFTQMTALKVHRKWHFRGDSKQNPIEADANSRDAQLSNQNSNQMSLNSQQHLQGLRAVGLMPNPRPHAKSQKRKLELKCEYCPSTFISNNNLRRHIYELHKDYITHLPAPPEIKCDENLHCRRCDLKFESKLEWIEHKVAEARTTKPYGPFQWGCDLCGAYVSRKEKLINHIHNHMKESFIVPVNQQLQQQQQQQAHAPSMMATNTNTNASQTSKNFEPVKVKQEIIETESMQQQNHEEAEESTEEDGSVLSGKGAYGEEATEDYEAVEVDAEVDEEEEDDDDDEDDDLDGSSDAPVVNVNENANDGQSAATDDDDDDEAEEEDEEEEEEEEDDDDDDDDEEEIDEDNRVVNESEDTTNQSMPENSANQMNHNNNTDSSEAELDDTSKDVDEDEDMDAEDNTVSSVEDTDHVTSTTKSRFSCDLCQVYFESQPELQQHVKMHFLNGPGSVTFSNKSKQNPRSNNNGNDAVTITTS